ncbi:acyl-CoA dehydrogenase family protein [Savagea sp. SN6]|uniref:Acyl-CoA dehydrogenase family protein n=1 Tax=Savagea serpentis TaxID=2785297 RepID=A0A8J7GDX8_9BACL|nr:acyl-CoA dehydrogenase family protein [Savagea serpentis]MBF4501846.1 acyl-CoA dehydrogenase family protein [Savagea serpentis]
MTRTYIFPQMNDTTKNFAPDHFNDEEKLIEQTVEQFAAERVYPSLEKLESYDYATARQLFEEAGELGLLGADVPEDYDGMEMGKKISGLVAEGLGHGSSFGVSFNIHTGVGTLPYMYFGTKEQKKKCLPKLASGEWIGAYALTEPNAGSDALAAKATAKLNDDGSYRLNGEKQWITNAHLANVYVVFAKTEEGMTGFIVERDMPGVSVGPEEQKMGIKGSSTATLILEDVNVPEENILGERGKGHYIALNILNLARLKLAFSNIGSGKQAFNTALQYTQERKQFNRELSQFSMLREKLAMMAASIYRAETGVYYTARLIDEEDLSEDNILKVLPQYAADCALNKVAASEMLDYVVDEGVQMHGGYGYMEEYDIERMYRDARINRIFEGTNEINRLTVARSITKLFTKDASVFEADDALGNEQYEKALAAFNKVMQTLTSEEVISLKEFENEQELMRLISDTVMDLYLMKAVLIRVEESKKRDIEEALAAYITHDSSRKIQANLLEITARIAKDPAALQGAIRDLTVDSVDLIGLKRQIADYMIGKGSYSL